MNDVRGTVTLVIGAVVAVLLQVMCAPNIALFGATPNFMAAYALVVAVVRPDRSGPVMAFLLGLLFDLLGSGPVGACAFLLTLATFLASRAFSVLDNDTLFMPLAIAGVSLLALEVLYGAFLLGTGLEASVLDALVLRAIPCALYDCVVALVMFPFARRFLVSATVQRPGTPYLH